MLAPYTISDLQLNSVAVGGLQSARSLVHEALVDTSYRLLLRLTDENHLFCDQPKEGGYLLW